jgi:hypothetical protein
LLAVAAGLSRFPALTDRSDVTALAARASEADRAG